MASSGYSASRSKGLRPLLERTSAANFRKHSSHLLNS
jgi:hypothetical protein